MVGCPIRRPRQRLLDAAWQEVAEHGDRATHARRGRRPGRRLPASRVPALRESSHPARRDGRPHDRTSGFTRRLAATRQQAPRRRIPRHARTPGSTTSPPSCASVIALEAAQLTGGDGADAYRDRMNDWWNGIRIAIQRLADAGAAVSRLGRRHGHRLGVGQRPPHHLPPPRDRTSLDPQPTPPDESMTPWPATSSPEPRPPSRRQQTRLDASQ